MTDEERRRLVLSVLLGDEWVPVDELEERFPEGFWIIEDGKAQQMPCAPISFDNRGRRVEGTESRIRCSAVMVESKAVRDVRVIEKYLETVAEAVDRTGKSEGVIRELLKKKRYRPALRQIDTGGVMGAARYNLRPCAEPVR